MKAWRVFALAWLVLLGVGSGGAARAAGELRFAVSRGPVSTLIYVAQAHDLFTREGVTVRVEDCHSGRQCHQALLDGEADLATAAEVVVAVRALSAGDTAILAAISASSHQIKLVGRKSAGIQRPQDLKGQTVATVAGSSAQYFLDSWLLFHGIEPSSLRMLYGPADELQRLMLRKDVGAVAIWEPTASAVMAMLGDDAVVLPNPRVYTQFFSVVAPRARLEPHARQHAAVLRALIRAQDMVAAQPQLAHAALAARLGITTTQAAVQLKEQDLRVRLDQALVNTLSSQLRWAAAAAQSAPRHASPPLPLIHPDTLRAVAPGAVTMAGSR